LILDAAESIAERDARAALTTVQRLSETGRDYVQFMRDLAAHLRHLFVVQTLGDVPESFAVTSEHTDRLAAQAGRMSQGEILRAIDLLAASIAAVKDGSEPRIQLEMALLKASQPSSDLSLQALMFRIEQLERRMQGGAQAAPASDGQSEAPAPKAAAPKAAAARASTPTAAPARAVATAPAVDPDPAPVGEMHLDLDRLQHLWPAALEVLSEDNELLGAALAEARPLSLDDGRLVVAFPPGSEFARKKAEAKREVVQRAIHGLTGASLVVAFEVNDNAAPPEPKRLSTDELIESVKRDFGATEVEVADEEEQA
jgi:DNA polymerase-3 subunit gamma/tau